MKFRSLQFIDYWYVKLLQKEISYYFSVGVA